MEIVEDIKKGFSEESPIIVSDVEEEKTCNAENSYDNYVDTDIQHKIEIFSIPMPVKIIQQKIRAHIVVTIQIKLPVFYF